MDLKTRLSALEQQISSLQGELLLKSKSSNFSQQNLPRINQIYENTPTDNEHHLKTILLKLKLEHQLVLESIEKALRLVDKSNPTTTTNMNNNYNNNNNSNNNTNIGTQMYSSPTRLFDKITSVINSPSSTPKRRVLLPSNNTTANTTTNSSPLSPALEKSYITFDILNDLENHQSQGTPTDRNGNKLFNHHSTETEHRRSPHSRSVHFSNTDTHQSTDLSMASQEYLKKYGLI